VLSGDVERVREQAREQGLAAGHGEGLERAAAGAQRLIDALGSLARESKAQFEHECETLRGSVVTIVEAVLRKIAGPLLASERAVVGATLEVLQQCTHGLNLKIFVCRQTCPSWRRRGRSWPSRLPSDLLSCCRTKTWSLGVAASRITGDCGRLAGSAVRRAVRLAS